MLKCKLCWHNGCPSALKENKNKFDNFGVFSTEADKSIHQTRDTRLNINRAMWTCVQTANMDISHHHQHIFYSDFWAQSAHTHGRTVKKKDKNSSPGYCYMKYSSGTWSTLIFQCNEKSSHTAPPFPSTQDLCRTLFPLENINCKCICAKERDEQSWETKKLQQNMPKSIHSVSQDNCRTNRKQSQINTTSLCHVLMAISTAF